MRALIRKELTELLPFAGAWLVVSLAIWFSYAAVPDALVWPDYDTHEAVGITGTLLGILLGLISARAERWRGTESYLLHRGVSSGSVLAAKIGVGGGLAYVGTVGPMLVWALSQHWSSPLAPVIDDARIVELAATGSVACIAYLAVFVVSSCRRSPALELILAPLAAAACLSWGIAITSRYGLPGAVGPMLVLAGSGAVGMSWTAYRLARARPDRDTPLPPRLHGVIAFGGLALMLPLVLRVGGAVQEELLRSKWSREPFLLHDRALDMFAMARWDPFERRWVSIEGEPLPEDQEVDNGVRRLDVVHNPLFHLGIERWKRNPVGYRGYRSRDLDVWQLVERSRLTSRVGPPGGQWTLHAWVFRTGRGSDLRVVRYLSPGNSANVVATDRELPSEPTLLVVRRPDGKSFGFLDVIECTRELVLRDQDILLLHDRADDSLWRLDLLSDDGIHRVELPNGDRFVGMNFLRSQAMESYGPGQLLSLVPCGVVGCYSWNGRSLEPLVLEDSEALFPDLEASQPWSIEWSDDGLTSSTLIVRRTGESDPALRYTYAVDEPRERILVGLASLITVMRPPWSVLASRAGLFSKRENVRFGSLFEDPLVDGGSPLWIVLASLGATLACAWIGLTRLRRRCAPGGLLVVWFVLFVLGGPLMVFVQRYLEGRTRRAVAAEPDTSPSDASRLHSM